LELWVYIYRIYVNASLMDEKDKMVINHPDKFEIVYQGIPREDFANQE